MKIIGVLHTHIHAHFIVPEPKVWLYLPKVNNEINKKSGIRSLLLGWEFVLVG